MLMDLGAYRRASWTDGLPNTPAMPQGFLDSASIGWRDTSATGLRHSEWLNEHRLYEESREVLRQAGLTTVPNPADFDPTPGLGLPSPDAFGRLRGLREDADRQYRAMVTQFRQQYPGEAGRALLPEEITQRARDNAVSARRASEDQEVVGGSWLGRAVGGMAAGFRDPLFALTMPLGIQARAAGTAASQIARTALNEAAIAAATQVPIEAVAAPYRQSIGLPSDFLPNIIEAAAGGAILGGGWRATSLALRRLGILRRTDGGAELTPLAREDAARVLEETGRIADTNPGMVGAVHEANLARATDAVLQGRLPVDMEGPDTGIRLAGGEARVFTPAGRAVGVRYELAELSSLIPSHTDDWLPNPAYPHAEGVQPRDRGRAASIQQIEDIAAKLNPELLGRSADANSGAPIVGPDEVVESGNGRVLALRRVYGENARAPQREAYRAWLEAQGFDTAGMQAPVLIARRADALSPDARRAFVQEATDSQGLKRSPTETARIDMQRVGDALDLYRGGEVDLAQNADFVRSFMHGLPASERADMMTAAGTISPDGARRIRNALVARAYGDALGPLLERMLDANNEGMRAIGGALQDVAGRWAAMREAAARGEIADGMDITADLLGAVRSVLHARQKGIRVADMLAQGDLDAPPLTTTGHRMLELLHGGDPQLERAASQRSVARSLGGYVDEAMKSRPGADMFGEPPPTGPDILDAASRRPARLETADPALGTQRTIASVADTTEVKRTTLSRVEPDATFLEAQRLAATKDFETATAAGPRSVVDVLAEAEQGVIDARNAAACLIGMVA